METSEWEKLSPYERCEWAYREAKRLRREEMVNRVADQDWQVWSEGYQATGESGGSTWHGTVRAPSFRDACDIVMRTPQWERYYDPQRLTYWGCRLFDNAGDASEAFG